MVDIEHDNLELQQTEPNTPEVELEATESTSTEDQQLESGLEQEKEESRNTYEDKARSRGWKPQEEWEGDPNDWKPAKAFVEKGELLDVIYSLKKTSEDQKKDLKALIDYQTRVKEREDREHKQYLEQQLANAKDVEDEQAYNNAAQQLKEIQDAEEASTQQKRDESLDNFRQRNSHWFNDRNPDLIQRTKEIGDELVQIYPHLAYNFEEQAKLVEKRISYEFPERFHKKEPDNFNISPSMSSVNKSTASYSTSDDDKVYKTLPSELKQLYEITAKGLKGDGISYTKKDFINRLRSDGEI